jgi:flagellar protein FlgJ
MIGPALSSVTQLSAPLGMSGSVTDGEHKPSLADAAKGFESVFLTMLLKEMRQTLEPGALFGKEGDNVYGGMFDQFMAQHLTQGKGMGLAQSLMKQLEPTNSHGPLSATHLPRT